MSKLSVLLAGARNADQFADEPDGRWITLRGTPVLVPEGTTKGEAVRAFISRKQSKVRKVKQTPDMEQRARASAARMGASTGRGQRRMRENAGRANREAGRLQSAVASNKDRLDAAGVSITQSDNDTFGKGTMFRVTKKKGNKTIVVGNITTPAAIHPLGRDLNPEGFSLDTLGKRGIKKSLDPSSVIKSVLRSASKFMEAGMSRHSTLDRLSESAKLKIKAKPGVRNAFALINSIESRRGTKLAEPTLEGLARDISRDTNEVITAADLRSMLQPSDLDALGVDVFADEAEGRWITVSGARVFIPAGADKGETVAKFLKEKAVAGGAPPDVSKRRAKRLAVRRAAASLPKGHALAKAGEEFESLPPSSKKALRALHGPGYSGQKTGGIAGTPSGGGEGEFKGMKPVQPHDVRIERQAKRQSLREQAKVLAGTSGPGSITPKRADAEIKRIKTQLQRTDLTKKERKFLKGSLIAHEAIKAQNRPLLKPRFGKRAEKLGGSSLESFDLGTPKISTEEKERRVAAFRKRAAERGGFERLS